MSNGIIKATVDSIRFPSAGGILWGQHIGIQIKPHLNGVKGSIPTHFGKIMPAKAAAM